MDVVVDDVVARVVVLLVLVEFAVVLLFCDCAGLPPCVNISAIITAASRIRTTNAISVHSMDDSFN